MRYSQQVIDDINSVSIREALNLLNIYWKDTKDGDDSYLHINHKTENYRVSVWQSATAKGLKESWNDRDTPKKADEPMRAGCISLLMHIEKIDFHNAVKRLLSARKQAITSGMRDLIPSID
jgi:hypothetical protein